MDMPSRTDQESRPDRVPERVVVERPTTEPLAATADDRVEVRVVTQQKDLALVEWTEDGEPRRAWLPYREVTHWKDGTLHATNPGRGVPYGDDFLRNVKLQATTEAVGNELRRRGIWTADDALANAPAVIGALQAVYGLDASGIMTAAAAYKREQRK